MQRLQPREEPPEDELFDGLLTGGANVDQDDREPLRAEVSCRGR